MQEPVESSELLAFYRTALARSLSRAAKELGVPRATLSRRLARLEERLGVRLIHRTTRRLQLTDAGETLLGHAEGVLQALRAAEASVHQTDAVVRGELRVSAPGAHPSIIRLMANFAARYPELHLEVHFGSQHVDLLSSGYDVVLRAGLAIDPGLVGRVLGRTRLYAVASPAYLRARGVPRSARELSKHACLLGYARGETRESYWPLRRGSRTLVPGAFTSNDPQMLKAAALAGLGIALLPSTIIHEEVATGALIPVLRQQVGADARFMVLHLDRQLVAPAVRAFVSAAVEWAKTDPFAVGGFDPELAGPVSPPKGRGKRR